MPLPVYRRDRVIFFLLKFIVDLQCFRYTEKWFSYICVCVLFQILFHHRLLQDTDYSSLCNTVGSYCLSILYVIKLNINPKFLTCPCFPFGNHKFVFHVCESVSLAGGSDGKESACSFDPWVGKIPWRREWQPIPVFLPREFQEPRRLAGYRPQDCKELDMTERLTLLLFHLYNSFDSMLLLLSHFSRVQLCATP